MNFFAALLVSFLSGENLKVESITINNNAKDIFTTKSTFQIDVVVNFKELNDLTDQFIEVKLLSDSTRSKKISFLNLIYRFLNAPAPAPTRALADARDSDGVYISLRMKIANNKKSNYQNLIKELNAKQDDVGQYLVTRTFHCIYHKHDIELNATTDAELVKLGVSKPLNNRLKISFVSCHAAIS